jgi:hypothetical protein
VSSHVHSQDIINVDQVEAQVQDRLLEDIICLKLGVHLVVMDM